MNFPTYEALSGINSCRLKFFNKVFWQTLYTLGQGVAASLLMLS